jgi:glycosidase
MLTKLALQTRMKTILFCPRLARTLVLAALLAGAHAADRDFSKESARSSPAWLRDSVVYELFPRAFSPAGNFTGVTARLDQLKQLGVDIVWLMPIHPIGDKLRKGTLGSPYAVRDYYGINPDYGTADDLKRLVAAAHQRGMKVILDVVLNHSAWDNALLREHPEFYKHDAAGQIVPPVADWKDVAGFDYANPQLRTYMVAMLKHWVTDFDVDGFRCDVASMVPADFWEKARAELERVKPEIVMLAEASQPDLLLKAFDFDYAWPLHATLNDVLLRGAAASEFRRSWEDSRRQFPAGSLHLRIFDDHDEARAVARFGLHGALAASVLMFTLDGVPLLYNGNEVGEATESGAPALFEKLPVFWEPKERPPLTDIYRELIKLRKQYAPFRNDRVVWLRNSNDADLVTLMRLDDKDEFVVVINFSNRPQVGWVEVQNDQQFKPVSFPGMPEPPATGFPLFRLGGFEWRIYHRAVAH